MLLKGDGNLQKTISLWQFLDLLQVAHYAPHGAWLAEDSYDLLPEKGYDQLGNTGFFLFFDLFF